VPYGTKTREEIISYADSAVSYLAEAGSDVVVVACNTATSMAIDYLRAKHHIPIIGMEPAVKPAATTHPRERVLVCATAVTIAGEKLHTLIENTFTGGCEPTLVALPNLVTLAEAGEFEKEKVISYLSSEIDKCQKYAAVVLGCTHFTYFKDSFRDFLGDVDIIDGTIGTVRRIVSVVRDKYDSSEQQYSAHDTLYVRSGKIVNDENSLNFFRSLEQRAEIQQLI
jgi:glutamate racemase